VDLDQEKKTLASKGSRQTDFRKERCHCLSLKEYEGEEILQRGLWACLQEEDLLSRIYTPLSLQKGGREQTVGKKEGLPSWKEG